MNLTIKRTVTVTITEMWTIVWTTDSAPNRTAEAQMVQPTAHSNAIPDSLVEEQRAERCASPQPPTDQQPDALPVHPNAKSRRKRGRGRCAQDQPKRPPDKSNSNPARKAP